MEEDSQEELLQTQDSQPQKRRFGLKRLVFTLIAALVVAGLVGGSTATYNYISQQNNTGVLLSTLKNTLAQEQLKFHAELNKKTAQEVGSFDQKLSIDGEYKKGAGLSATTDSTVGSAEINLKVKSKWIVDAADKNSTYVNIASFDTEAADGAITPAMDKMKNKIVDNNNKSFNSIWTKYSNTLLRGTYSNTGVHGCSPKTFYKTLAKPQEFQTFMTRLADVLKIEKTDSTSQTNTYTIVATPGKYDTANKLYAESTLYKDLTACDPVAYSIAGTSPNDTVKNLIMTVRVDSIKNIITSITIKNKDSLDFSLTLTPATNVTISVPKTPTEILSDDAIEKYPQFSYDFEHLSDVNNVIKYGACYNFEKYKELLPPEAIKTCQQVQKSK